MTNFTLTIDSSFANGVGNSMDPSHWTTPLGEVETLLQGRVGRDGVGIDNWSGNEALRGESFRAGGLAESFSRVVEGESWGVSQMSLGSGNITKPLPGGSIRFYLRGSADIIVSYAPRFVARHSGSAAAGSWAIHTSTDGGAETQRGSIALSATAYRETSATPALVWSDSALAAGWHYLEHRAIKDDATSGQVVVGASFLSVVAVYR